MLRLNAALALGVILLMALGSVPLTIASGNPTVSYNPGAASKYHAPLSGMGLVAVTRSYAGFSGTQTSVTSPATSAQPQGVPAGLSLFINDSSYAPQSETTIAVDPSNTQHVLGGYNDGKWFFCPDLRAEECPNGYTKSITGFTTSVDGGSTVAKSNDLPGVTETERNLTSGTNAQGFLLSWGDPSVAPAPGGTFYFSSLAIDPVSGANGILLEESNSNLWSTGSSCSTPLNSPDSNPCWSTHFIFGNLTYQCFGAGICGTSSFEDKDTIAVDTNPSSAYYGYAYVAWDHFYANGDSASFVARCSPSLTCTMISGGTAPVVSGSDLFAGNATPAVSQDGTLYVAWCDFGTETTYGPVYCSARSSSNGGTSFGLVHSVMSFMGAGTQLAGDTVIGGFATEQFRAASEFTIAAGSSGDVYFAIPLCVSGFYYRFNNDPALPPDNPGNCGTSAVFFSRSTDGGASWSTPVEVSAEAVVIQPTITYDPQSGVVALAYYTTRFDPFNHRIDVGVLISKDQGQSFSFVRATPVSNEPNSDPSLFAYQPLSSFGGSFVVPQYGDYFTAFAYGGRVWVLFTGNYAQVQGTYKENPFLAVVGETPSTLNFSSNARDSAPGDTVNFQAGGFTPGSTLRLSVEWDGIAVSLANSTVSSSGQTQGNFTVPNIQSQVYTVVAADGTGLASTAPLGVGQVSLGGVQGSLASIQRTLSSLSGSMASGFASLNSSVASLGKSLSGVGSPSTITELLSFLILVVVALILVLQFRKRGVPQAAAPSTIQSPLPGTGGEPPAPAPGST
jgi:hypothetical protein